MIELRIARSLVEGRRLLLADRNLDTVAAPPALAGRIRATFGEDLSPLQVVERIVADVRAEGDAAIERYGLMIDGTFHGPLRVDKADYDAARLRTPAALIEAFETSAKRILEFHRRSMRRSWFETSPEGTFGQIVRPLSRVGLYVPGGTASYPSSLLMTALPAKAAGVKEVIVATPPGRDGAIPDSVLVAAQVAGVTDVYRVGGAQAIAAMAYGTESLPRVDKILGPGNIFVALAKRLVSGSVGIDSVAGPTETLIVADESAKLEHVAADLLAQAEHDPMAQPVLISTSPALIDRLAGEVENQLTSLSRETIARESISCRGAVVLVADLQEAVTLANEYAPEHLCLEVADPWSLLDSIQAAGGVFLGERSVEALGDYVAGPSHVMPTGGSARFSSPLTVDDFVKISSLFAMSEQGLRDLGPTAVRMAEVEGLTAHAASVQRRLDERQE